MSTTADEYKAFFEQLKSELHHSTAAREGWIGYLYHVTDVHNAVSILQSGSLICRAEAIKLQKMRNDNAAMSVMSVTDREVSDYVRLYFRPKTPTFYRNEGFRSKHLQQSGLNAHCPVPVAFVFDAAEVLSLPGVRFSDQNLAGGLGKSLHERTFQGLPSLRALPFEGIYHSDILYRDDPKKPEIIRQRNAEVIVPKQLPLEGMLLAVRSRSDAELATLRNLLDYPTWSRYRSQAGINTDASLFISEWLFIDRVYTANGALHFRIHQPKDEKERNQVFNASITVEFMMSSRAPVTVHFELRAGGGPLFRTDGAFLPSDEFAATISIHLNGELAYKGVHTLEDDPMIFPPDQEV